MPLNLFAKKSTTGLMVEAAHTGQGLRQALGVTDHSRRNFRGLTNG
jgi:hypothetical protein